MKSARLVWHLSISLPCYLVANAFLTFYVDPTGTFGTLAAVPLWFAVRLWGRPGGLSTAGATVVMNSIVYVALGEGLTAFRQDPGLTLARLALEIIAFGAFVLVIDLIEASRRELGASRLREKLSTELLSETERKYRTLIELAPEAILVTVDSRIVYSNTRLFEMSGYRMEEILGAPFLNLIAEEDRSTATKRAGALLRGETPAPMTIRYRRRDGETRWIEIFGGATEWEGDAAILYLFSDVSERKTLEQQLVQAQKMEAIGRLAGGIAHDFNNVLQVVIGYTDYIKTKMGNEEAVAKAIGSIRAASDRAASMTRQLLSFSRREVLEPEAVNLAEFLKQTVGILRPLLGDDISVTLESESNDIAVMVDPGQLQQVVMNLAVNARDAMCEGGWLRISARRAEHVDCPSCIEIAVSDTGVGMDEEVRSHLFEPFFTTKEPGKGTGLGLANVNYFVERSGGHIHVSSKKGVGTTFSLHLPGVPVNGGPNPQRKAPPATRAPRFGKVLLIENDPQVTLLMRDVLSDAGYSVTAAANGSEAVKIAHGDRAIRVVISDYVLSGMSGTQTAQEVMKEIPTVKVIFVTGRMEKMDHGPTEPVSVLRKPFTIEELVRTVDDAFEVPES